MPRMSQEKQLAKSGHRSLAMVDPSNPPKVIAKDKIALACWHATIAQLQTMGRFQPCDLPTIERYAFAFSLTRRYEEMCAESGGIQTCRTGYQQVSPELSCFLKSSAELRCLEKALSLSVVARAESGLVEETTDELSAFIAAG